MAIQTPNNSPSFISPQSKSPTSIKAQTVALRQLGATAQQCAEALDVLDSRSSYLYQTLQGPVPVPDAYQILDASGKLVAAIGFIVGADHRVYPGGYFTHLYVGPNGPDQAVLYSDGHAVYIGKNGFVSILDPYGNTAAWIGSQTEGSKNIAGVANNGSGLFRLTVAAHGYRTGNWVNVQGAAGAPATTGQWLVTVIDVNHFDLQGSTYAAGYTSGGTVNRFFGGGAFETIAVGAGQRITGAVDNGAGLVRLTITGHGYETGYAAVTTNVQGVPGANGSFLVMRVDANHVDLVGSVFTGAYVSGGISINWPTAKFVAEGDGSLYITNALIRLIGTGAGSATITLDPTLGTITVAANSPATTITTIGATGIEVGGQTAHDSRVFIDRTQVVIWSDYNAGATIGPSTRVQSDRIELWNAVNTATITMSGVTGSLASLDLNVSGALINSSREASNFASMDSAVYKVGGTTGLGVAQTVVQSLTFTTASAITSVTGPGVTGTTSGTFVTGGIFVTKLMTYDSGVLIGDV